MDYYDDDEYFDDDEFDDEDELDDDDEEIGVSGRGVNPFARGGSSSGSGGLPGPGTFGSGNRPGGNRPADSGSGAFSSSSRLGSSGGTPGRFGAPSRSGGGDDEDDDEDRPSGVVSRRPSSGDRPAFGSSRPGTGPLSRPSSGGDKDDDSKTRSSPFSRPSAGSLGRPGSGDRDDDSKSRPSTFSSRPGTGPLGRPGSSGGDRDKDGGAKPRSSPFSRSGDDDKDKDRPSSFGGGGRPAGNRPAASSASRDSGSKDRPDKRGGDDEKSSGGGLGGLASGLGGRLPFGKKKDGDAAGDRPANQRDRKSGPKDSGEKSGSPLGGLGKRLPFGNKSGDGDSTGKAPARPKPGGDRPQGEKSGNGGALGGLAAGLGGRLRRGGSEGGGDKSPKPKAAASDSSGIGSRLNPFSRGQQSGGDQGSARPGASQDSGGKSGTFGAATKRSPFGKNKSGDAPDSSKQSKVKKADGEKTGVFANLTSKLPFGGRPGAKPKQRTSKTRAERASKVPHAREGEGLTLDDKLDILGVGLVFGAIVLFVSSLSGQQGAITGAINKLITDLVGWGALGIPVAMGAIGIWLIIRHFGEEAPEIDPVRISGVVMLYVGALMIFMFIETFNPDVYTQATQAEFYQFIIQSIESGRGGGYVGGELYSMLVVNIGEFGAIFVIIGWTVVGLMLTTRTSAAELAIFVISIWRSFQIAIEHRAQKRRALQLAKQEQLAAKQDAISISKPEQGALPAGGTAALPPGEHLPIEQRPIPIKMGGRQLEAEPAMAAAGNGSSPQQQTAEQSSRGALGLGKRLLSVLPGVGDSSTTPEGTPQVPSAAALSATASPEVTAPVGQTAPVQQMPQQQPLPTPQTPAAQAVTPPQPAEPQRPAAVFGTPQNTPPTASPPASDPQIAAFRPSARPPAPDKAPEDDLFSRLPAARPPMPAADDDDEDGDDESSGIFSQRMAGKAGKDGDAMAERMNRLNALRSGEIQKPKGQDDDEVIKRDDLRSFNPFADDDDEDEDGDMPDMAPAASKPVSPFARPGDVGGASKGFRLPTTEAATPAKVPEPAASPPPTERPAAAAKPPLPTINGNGVNTPTPQQPAAQRPAASEPVINRPPEARPSPAAISSSKRKHWTLPDTRTLLASGSEQEFDRDTLVQKARTIEETLQSFGAPGRVVEINTGPVITQFGVEPDYISARGGKKSRVKVSSIATLDKDLQLALGAKSIRIEAPVPGKGFVGVEVPNDEASLVSLRDVMESKAFNKIKSPLALALGQSVDGAPVAADLTSMPHLLVAGTTGSGKSVLVNAIIASLLTRNTPDVVKFIMVDPKRVELTGYNGIPHLVAPVVVELERIVGVLKWVTREMDDRYKRFSDAGARNIEDFNSHLPENGERMPYIVVIIDELADLMMLAPEETERVITRIAALARATGIHLVIATQRPSVDVVTGLIKANFPARVAFAVAGSVDSRVILDQPGAERLLGKGDMLYLSPDSPAPLRLQGVYVSDMEINNINRFWKAQTVGMEPQQVITQLVRDEDTVTSERRPVMQRGDRFSMTPPPSTQGTPQQQPSLWDQMTSATSPDNHSAGYGSSERENNAQEDELYDEAVELVRRLNKASVSLLQRRLRIGYTRAARLIDIMESEGIVGPPTEGSKPRTVLPTKEK